MCTACNESKPDTMIIWAPLIMIVLTIVLAMDVVKALTKGSSQSNPELQAPIVSPLKEPKLEEVRPHREWEH